MKILIVDDNKSNKELLKLLIDEWFEDNNEDLEYQLDFADNGKIALDMIQTNIYDLVFLDIMMPVLDGFSVLEKLDRKSFNDETKIILSSAIINDDSNKKRAKKLKANGFLVKPISFESLNEILKRYVCVDEIDSFDDFMDLEDDLTEEDSLLMDDFNESHIALSAIDFLSKYTIEDINEEDIYEHEELINNLLFHIEENREFEEILLEMNTILKNISNTLISFTEIEEVLHSLNGMVYTLEHIKVDINTLDKTYIYKLFVAIAEDLNTWEKVVFIERDTNNINYINASLLNSYIMLKKGLGLDVQ
ncbi:MAG: response regulator [Campylobacterota bacterium]|nr:response regulator [Campylobacterota bacterium]